MAWSHLPLGVVTLTTWRGHTYHLAWSHLPHGVVRLTTWRGQTYHLAWSHLPLGVVTLTTWRDDGCAQFDDDVENEERVEEVSNDEKTVRLLALEELG